MIYDWISMFYNQSIVGEKKVKHFNPKIIEICINDKYMHYIIVHRV